MLCSVQIFQLTYSTTRYGLYEVVSAELRKGDGKKISAIHYFQAQQTTLSSTEAPMKEACAEERAAATGLLVSRHQLQ